MDYILRRVKYADSVDRHLELAIRQISMAQKNLASAAQSSPEANARSRSIRERLRELRQEITEGVVYAKEEHCGVRRVDSRPSEPRTTGHEAAADEGDDGQNIP